MTFNTKRIISFNLNSVFICCLLVFLCLNKMYGQKNAAARYEIDAKRIGVYPTSKDALPRSKEFIRLDSTYYVGHMYEGMYKYERSSDYVGYKQAIAPLYKALTLLEKDYGDKLKIVFSSVNNFYAYKNYFDDFYQLSNTLESCYNSIEMPDSTMSLINKIEGYNFQRDFFNIGSTRAWLYHRNRFYTSEKFSFLKNTIEENEKMAYNECYKQLSRIQKNKAVNDAWYGPYQSHDDNLTVYHYLAILHDYNLQYDSSHYYYQILIDNNRVVWSNYANLKHVTGDFAEAYDNYIKPQYKRKFSLNETDYFVPMLMVYGGQTKTAIQMSRDKIAEVGSTPGFGWYNIALARGYLYDGQLDSCNFFLDKAAHFKELHINTTFTQSHYEFAINVLRIQMISKKLEQIKFQNSGWWYSPSDLYDLLATTLEKTLLQYATVSALANNPEREQVIYSLFASEAIISYDETMFLLKDFCSPFFEAKYEGYTLTEPRENIVRYMKLASAQFALARDKEEDVKTICNELLEETFPSSTGNASSGERDKSRIDTKYEMLYAYRVFELLSQVNEDTEEYDTYRNKCFDTYPQLMLYSGITAKLNISFSGLQDDEMVKEIMEDIKDCNIEISEETNIPKAKITFDKKGKNYIAIIDVIGSNDKVLVKDSKIIFKENIGIGKEIGLRLFGKGGSVKFGT